MSRTIPPKLSRLKYKENIWDELNHRVRRTGAIPTTLNQLRAKIIYEWKNTPQNYVQRYVASLSCRSEQCRGGGGIPATKFTWTRTPLQDLTVIFTLFCDIFDQVWPLLK